MTKGETRAYMIEKRVVKARTTNVFYFAGREAVIGGYRWETDPACSLRLSYRDACAIIKQFRQIAAALGNDHLLYRHLSLLIPTTN